MENQSFLKNVQIKKPNFDKAANLVKKPLVKEILNNLYLGAQCWLVIFILGQIFISGGKSPENPYFIAVIVLFLSVSQAIFISREKYSSLKATIISAVSVALAIAILDYLVVNLWLAKNNLVIYKYWPYYFVYLTALGLPFIRVYSNKISSFNPVLLLTKKNRSL